MVDVQLNEGLWITSRPGDERALEVVVTYETNSQPWDEGMVQIRNVIGMNIDGEYSRDELLGMLTELIPNRERIYGPFSSDEREVVIGGLRILENV